MSNGLGEKTVRAGFIKQIGDTIIVDTCDDDYVAIGHQTLDLW